MSPKKFCTGTTDATLADVFVQPSGSISVSRCDWGHVFLVQMAPPNHPLVGDEFPWPTANGTSFFVFVKCYYDNWTDLSEIWEKLCHIRAAIISTPEMRLLNPAIESRSIENFEMIFLGYLAKKFDAPIFVVVGHSVYCHRRRPDTVLLLGWDELGSLALHGVSVASHWVAMAQNKTFWVFLFS